VYQKALSGKKKTIRIATDLLQKNQNQFVVANYSGRVDKLKQKRKLLTNTFHSKDSQLALEFKLYMKRTYDLNCLTVHDCFSVPPGLYREACLIYKKLAKQISFDQKITSQIFLGEHKQYPQFLKRLESIQSRVDRLKKHPD
jgi:hypothetical protein